MQTWYGRQHYALELCALCHLKLLLSNRFCDMKCLCFSVEDITRKYCFRSTAFDAPDMPLSTNAEYPLNALHVASDSELHVTWPVHIKYPWTHSKFPLSLILCAINQFARIFVSKQKSRIKYALVCIFLLTLPWNRFFNSCYRALNNNTIK